MSEFHTENPIEWIVAQIGIVAISTEEEQGAVVLLEVVRKDNERSSCILKL
jgi:hypothetical protein